MDRDERARLRALCDGCDAREAVVVETRDALARAEVERLRAEVAAEREACAQVADRWVARYLDRIHRPTHTAGDAIRARGAGGER